MFSFCIFFSSFSSSFSFFRWRCDMWGMYLNFKISWLEWQIEWFSKLFGINFQVFIADAMSAVLWLFFCILQIYLHSMKQPLGPKDMSRFCPFSDSLFRHSFRMSNSYCMFPLTVYCVSHKRWWWLLKLHVRLLRELRENKISRKLVVVVAVLVFHYSTYTLVWENETKQNWNANELVA